MTVQPLYNLSPLAQVMLAGALAALGPLTWVWLRNRRSSAARWAQALTLLTLFLTFDLVLFGAFTRLTDSGLGCPDWPGCYGHASPVGASVAITAAQSAMPTGPVTHGKAWVEMVHRYLATGVGVLILVLTVTGWVRERRATSGAGGARAGPAANPWWPTVTLVWVCLQGAFGALTVTMKLFPAIVTLHLLGGMVLLSLLCAQAVRATQALGGVAPEALAASTRRLLWLTCALVACQIALGGWVSTNYAVLACSQFPLCQNSWWPDMNFHQGFQIWRRLGMTPGGTPIDFSALTAIHFTHRLFAVVVFMALGLLVWRLRRSATLRPQARWIAGLLLWQFATGLGNELLGWPLVAAVSHTGGAAALVVVLTWTACTSRSAARAVTAVSAPASGAPTSFVEVVRMNTIASAAPMSHFKQYYALTKPRVIQLIVFCALIGMLLAVPGLPSAADMERAAIACVGIWLVAAAAAAFNCLVEHNIDAKMKRTAWRPTAKGELGDGQALLFSAVLFALGSAVLYVWINPLTMWLTFATFVGYAIIYTVILKPLTPQNIVIGGASGAMPPVLGWAAMRGDVGPEALILFLIIFLWTPPHFWALALYRVEDYRKSGLPMLPVTHGNAFTRLQVFLYTLILFAGCLMPFIYGMSSWLYLAAAVILCTGFCVYGFRLWRNYSDALARRTFRFSLIHLSVLFAALLLDHYLF